MNNIDGQLSDFDLYEEILYDNEIVCNRKIIDKMADQFTTSSDIVIKAIALFSEDDDLIKKHATMVYGSEDMEKAWQLSRDTVFQVQVLRMIGRPDPELERKAKEILVAYMEYEENLALLETFREESEPEEQEGIWLQLP